MNMLVRVMAGGILIVLTAVAQAAVDSGNTLALEYLSAERAQKSGIRKDATGKIFFFRYLRIVDLEKGETGGLPYIRMSTVEPSSDMVVDFVITKKVSLKKAASLKKGEAVAVLGRIKSIGKKPNRIVLDPVIVKYKDRLAPKIGKELLCEVDPDARYATFTDEAGELVELKGKHRDLLPWNDIEDPEKRKEAKKRIIGEMGGVEKFGTYLRKAIEAREKAGASNKRANCGR